MWLRLAPVAVVLSVVFAACTPEATIVFINAGGSAGSGGSGGGSGGEAGLSGEAGAGESGGGSGGSSTGDGGAPSNGGGGEDGDVCDEDCREGEVCCDEGGCSGRCVGDCREGAPCPDDAECGPKGFCVHVQGGSGGAGGAGGAPSCEVVSSPDNFCDDCIREDCATELADCEENDCACGQWGAETGQANCMIRCMPFRPDPLTLDDCAESCGLSDYASAHPATRALVDCMAEGAGPGNPPVCAACFDPPA